jgi:hypothetical protein
MPAVLIALLIMAHASGQSAGDFPRYTPRMLAYKTLPEDEKTEDVQRNFFQQNWRTGTVSFRNTPDKAVVPLLFDVYSNRLYFLSGNSILEFANPVKEFLIPVVAKQDTLQLLYRNGYPAIHKNIAETFYEVLVDGKFQLLRCKAKTIALYKDKDVPEEERDYSKELLYALLPGEKIILVKKDKDYLLKEMPEHAGQIEQICVEEKLKLKNEAQLKTLFVALNK